MKRFWLVLLSLGLVLAFSASAMAVDVKFSGSFYAAGMYIDKTSLKKTADGSDNVSTAFYYQRLRLQTDFIVASGLKLVTRLDAMERIWGGQRSSVPFYTTADSQSAGTRAENENIAFDWAYVEYASPIGLFQVGYMADNVWGTQFHDNGDGPPAGIIKYILPIGPLVLIGGIYKEGDLSKSAGDRAISLAKTDMDTDKYVLAAIYNVNKDINLGVLYAYTRGASGKPAVLGTLPWGMLQQIHVLYPYVKAKIGPVKVEAEVGYAFGYAKWEDNAPATMGGDVKVENLSAYINAGVDIGMVYGGLTFAYISGDDPGTADKREGGVLSGGVDYNPTLIMFNQERTYWAGALPGYGTSANASPMSNVWFGQGKVGVRPIPVLDINGSVSYGQADKKPASYDGNKYGWEIDVTGTYKITNNLSYMLGVGYWFVGDYYKATSNLNELRDDFMVINKLTLTF